MKIYVDNHYIAIDPVPKYARRNTASFMQEEALKNLTKEQEKFLKHCREYNINHGFIVPIHQSGQYPSCVVYTSKSPFKLAPISALSLEMVARIAFERLTINYDRVKNISPIKLSNKERQILQLVSLGKTNWEIGKILDISEFSVRDYLSGLSKRFETSNRTHTVTHALQLGLITL